ncbi:hypothetical protein ACOMHN_055448 [Nucella lapillus]
MSSSGESSDPQVVHIIQPSVSVGASSVVTEEKAMQAPGGAVACPMGGTSHLIMGGVLPPPHLNPSPAPHQPDSTSSSSSSSSSEQQYTVEEQVTTVRIPMRRPYSDFLEILHEAGAHEEVFTMSDIIHHVKNYIIKHQLYDRVDPRIVYCGGNALGRVFDVDQFTINEAVPLFMKHTYAIADSCIRIRRQLVKRAVDSSGAACGMSVPLDMGRVTSTVTSTTGSEGGIQAGGATAAGARSAGGSYYGGPNPDQAAPAGSREKDGAGGMYEGGRGRRTSVNIEYGDEVDGASTLFQVNMATNSQSSHAPSSQAPEEDSVSVQYDSDHFAVEYELDSSDHHSESEHNSHSTTKDFVIIQKESDVEFWADYSETETNSDTELGDADHWQCEACHTSNVPFYRNCSKCWALRPGWLPDSTLPSSSTSPSSTFPLPTQPRGTWRGYYAPSSNDELMGSGQGDLRSWRSSDKVRRRRVRVMSASSSERSSDSLVSLSDDDVCEGGVRVGGDDSPPSASQTGEGMVEDSGMSSTALTSTSSQKAASSQETPTPTADSSSQSQSQPLHPPDADPRRAGAAPRRAASSTGARATRCAVTAAPSGCGVEANPAPCVAGPSRKSSKTIQKVIKNFVL